MTTTRMMQTFLLKQYNEMQSKKLEDEDVETEADQLISEIRKSKTKDTSIKKRNLEIEERDINVYNKIKN